MLIFLSCNQKKEEPSFEINRPEKVEVIKQHYLSGIFKLKTVNDTVFNLSEYYGFEATQPYLTFDTTSNIASGHSGCNNFTAPFTISDSQIKFSEPPMATEIGCEDGNKWENQFFDLLNDQPFIFRENSLTMKNDQLKLTFTKD
ncbi:hypothetical protein BST97_02400 [Nonlabens spongiae]|uniref:DUF306 domain-containing protein n=2 Tax=Nonlabens spongiae TaxID=331648 RepID=A0A1W6MH84_9FLAO|nr:hypothetical protein BST97_02400 [Nonlabens spongiae]